METLQVVEWVAITTVGIAVYIVGYGTFYQCNGPGAQGGIPN